MDRPPAPSPRMFDVCHLWLHDLFLVQPGDEALEGRDRPTPAGNILSFP